MIKELGRGTGKKEAVRTGNISNGDMKFVKPKQRKKQFADGFIESVIVV